MTVTGCDAGLWPVGPARTRGGIGNLLRGIAHLADRNPLIPAIDNLLGHLGGDLLRLAR